MVIQYYRKGKSRLYTQENLKESISKKRQEMITLAFTKGFTNKATVECSQELDRLMNLLYKEASSSKKVSYLNKKLHKNVSQLHSQVTRKLKLVK